MDSAIKKLRGRLEVSLADKQPGNRLAPSRKGKPRITRLRRGDVVEMKVARGLAYAQYINDHKNYGKLLRVVPGIYTKRPTNFEAIVATEGGWCAFWLIASGQPVVTVIGSAAIPKSYQNMPVFKLADRSIVTALVRSWSIWDGKEAKGRPVASLTVEQKRFPLAESVFTEDLIKRINKRWKPEDECLPGATSTSMPLKIPKEVLARRARNA